MADRRAPEPAAVHRIVRRLLVFELPDQLALCIADCTGDVRVVRDRYQHLTAGKGCAQRDALLLAATVLQGDFYVHIIRIPPAKMRLERGQRLYDVQTLLGYETHAYVDHVLAENILFRVVRFPHWGLISGAGRGLFDLSRFDACLDEGHVAGHRNRRVQGVMAPIARTSLRLCLFMVVVLLLKEWADMHSGFSRRVVVVHRSEPDFRDQAETRWLRRRIRERRRAQFPDWTFSKRFVERKCQHCGQPALAH